MTSFQPREIQTDGPIAFYLCVAGDTHTLIHRL